MRLRRLLERVRATVRVSLRGAVFVIVGVALVAGGTVGGLPELVYAGGVLVLAVLLALAVVAIRRPSVDVVRRLDRQYATVGEVVDVDLAVQNRRAVSAPVTDWSERIDGAVAVTGRLPRIPARSAGPVRIRYRVDARERGERRLGPVRLTIADPFGLAVAERTVPGERMLTVTPRVTPLVEVAFVAQRELGTAARRPQHSDRTVRDLVARSYRPGDPLRHMHWRATAHRGELMVRQEEDQERSRALLVLDTRRGAYLDADELQRYGSADRYQRGVLELVASARFEWAVEAIASLAAYLDAADVATTLVTGDDAEAGDVPPEPLHTILVRLARVGFGQQAPIAAAGAVLADAPQPLFAVAGPRGASELADWAALRSRSDWAVALVPGGVRGGADALASAGWHVNPVDAQHDIGYAWSRETAVATPGIFSDLLELARESVTRDDRRRRGEPARG